MAAKIQTIAKAFLDKLPEGEEWYERRLAACLACEHNTANADVDKMGIIEKSVHALKDKKLLCPKGSCNICGCCVDRKSAVKTETCALAIDGKIPKWYPEESQSKLDSKLSIHNLESENTFLRQDNIQFIFKVDKLQNATLSKYLLKRKGGINVVSVQPSCSCVHNETRQIDSETVEITTTISTLAFRVGKNEKTNTIKYYTDKNQQLTATVRYQMEKL